MLSIDLSASINAAFATARTAADCATNEARAAITAAVQCGDLLTRQKASVPHGTWLDWLAAHCPDISAETARRYMRLSKRSQVTDLTDATSLRQAYLATGFFPNRPLATTTTPTPTPPSSPSRGGLINSAAGSTAAPRKSPSPSGRPKPAASSATNSPGSRSSTTTSPPDNACAHSVRLAHRSRVFATPPNNTPRRPPPAPVGRYAQRPRSLRSLGERR